MREIANIDVELLDATMDHIETHPDLHDQKSWAGPGGRVCFAGRAALLSGAAFPPPSVWDTGMFPWLLHSDGSFADLVRGDFTEPNVSVHTWAQRKLGLTMDQARVMFSPLRTPESLRVLVDLLKSDPAVDETEMIAVAYAYEAVPEDAYSSVFPRGWSEG